MNVKFYHDSFEKAIKDIFTPDWIVSQLIQKKLIRIGIKLTEAQLEKISKHFARARNEDLIIQFPDEVLLNTRFKSEKKLQKAVQKVFDETANDIDKRGKELIKKIPQILERASNEAARGILRSLKNESREIRKNYHNFESAFESRLYRTWGKGLSLLETLIFFSLETGGSFNAEYREDASRNDHFVIDSLTRLHSRACQVAQEVLTLLKSGFGDGAHARWRSLHEISVICLLLGSHDNVLAERYLLHHMIESQRATEDYQKNCKALGYKPLSRRELRKRETVYNELLTRFGKDYGGEYGWAAEVIGKAKPTFRDIESFVGLSYLRPFYRMSSHNVHANSKGLFFRLGLNPPITQSVLLAGPSNAGLADPGHQTAISLTQITTTLLVQRPNIDTTVLYKVLLALEDEVGRALIRSHEAVTKRWSAR
jgi:hypothetical protein